MAEKQETIADIIAWLRRPREGENAYLTLWRDEIADRLEAAIRHERGDCAKLREALGKFRAELWNNTVIAGKRKFELYEIADAALAAKPRNCDLARDWLHDLYVHFKPPASVRREMPPEWVDAVMAFCRWLVAPATKGGAK